MKSFYAGKSLFTWAGAKINRTLHDVRELTEAWMTDYNECRPHESLANMTPMEYREKKKVG